jgi:hypothetical protein
MILLVHGDGKRTEYSTSYAAFDASSTKVSSEVKRVSIVSSENAWYSAVDIVAL